MLPPEIARTPPRTGTQRPDLTENTGAEIPRTGLPHTGHRATLRLSQAFAPGRPFRCPHCPSGGTRGLRWSPPEEDKGCPALPSGRYSRSGRFRMPVSPCRTGPPPWARRHRFHPPALPGDRENRRTPPALASRRGLPHRSPPAEPCSGSAAGHTVPDSLRPDTGPLPRKAGAGWSGG